MKYESNQKLSAAWRNVMGRSIKTYSTTVTDKLKQICIAVEAGTTGFRSKDPEASRTYIRFTDIGGSDNIESSSSDLGIASFEVSCKGDHELVCVLTALEIIEEILDCQKGTPEAPGLSPSVDFLHELRDLAGDRSTDEVLEELSELLEVLRSPAFKKK